MKGARRILCGLLMLGTVAFASDSWFDRIDQALTFSTLEDRLRARVSGTLDLEGYHLYQPAPALIYTRGKNLFNPRLSLFLDAQWGDEIYAFAHARLDRGFDPSEAGARLRLDEYAVRFSPAGAFNVQVGKFATIVGNWVPRHGSWANGFVTAPLPYENLTAIWDTAAARSTATLLNWAHVGANGLPSDEYPEKPLRAPIIWGPSYAQGVAVFGEVASFNYSIELKNASLSSNPEVWAGQEDHWRHPTVSARLGYQPNEMWRFGFSASTGSYLRSSAEGTILPGRSLGDYRQTVFAQDVSFAWHHWQLWAEAFEARFAIPGVGDADTFAYYVEAKYKITPQFFGALRWNQQSYGTMTNSAGQPVHWGRNAWRIDVAPTYRFTPHLQAKLQYSLQHESNGPRRYGHRWAAQFVLRF
ncbi:MAG: hypothetical protein ABIZ81_14485 [Opitutaceae bacterium]